MKTQISATPASVVNAARSGWFAGHRLSWRGYVLALIIPTVVLLLRLSLTSWIGSDRPVLILFVIPITVCAYLGGLGPGLLSTLAIALGVSYFLIPPLYSFSFARPVDFAQWILLIATGILISALTEALHRARQQAEATAQTIQQVEKAIQQQARLLNISFDAILVRELEGKIVFWNQGAIELYGFSADQAVGQVSHELLKVNYPEGVGSITETLRRTGTWTGVLQHRTQAGQLLEVESRQQLVQEADGRRQVLEINRDITERHRAEQSIQESQARLSAIIETAMDAIVTTDDQFRIVLFNSAAEMMFGYKAADILGQPVDRLIPQRYRAGHAEHMRHFAQTHETRRIMGCMGILRGLHASGEIFPMETSIALTEIGGRQFFTAIHRDVTERMRAAAEIEQIARFPAEDPSPVLRVSYDGTLLYANPASQPLLHIWQCKVGERLPDFLLEPGPRGTKLGLNRRTLEVEYQDRVYFVTFVPIPGETYTNLYGLDITERKQAEAQTQRLNAELEQRVSERTAQLAAANQELETFAYSVSHDLKAPLRGIDGYSRLLLEDYADKFDEEGRTFLHNIRRSSQNMGALIDDLLAYSRMERQTLQRNPVEVQPLVQAIVAERQQEIHARGVEMRVELPPLTIRADPDGLAMVLRNLIENALKFTRTAPHPVVEIGGQAADNLVTLWVRDNGIGFDMKFHDRIFEIFQRLHRAEDYPGTGVGLALVRRAMRRMGGRVWADSTPGQGATFYMEFPA